MPVILKLRNNLFCAIHRNNTLLIKFVFISHYPEKLGSGAASNPVAGNGGAFAGGSAQVFLNRFQPFFRDDGLPGIVSDAVGTGIQYLARFFEGFLFTLGDEGHHHNGPFPLPCKANVLT